MNNEIISYLEMCQQEGINLQKGMNFNVGGNHSIILMSVRPNAPYRDKIEDDGATLIYEGHDIGRTKDNPDPKIFDQTGILQARSPKMENFIKLHKILNRGFVMQRE